MTTLNTIIFVIRKCLLNSVNDEHITILKTVLFIYFCFCVNHTEAEIKNNPVLNYDLLYSVYYSVKWVKPVLDVIC